MKGEYNIRAISKGEGDTILKDFHYLSKTQRGWKSGSNWGLFRGEELLGVAIFTGLPVPEIARGAFGLERHEQDGLWELSRLCIHPNIQGVEHNIAGWFLARAIRQLCRSERVRSILSYADDDHHSGTVYAATGWKYYGLTEARSDFWYKLADGTYKKHSRGKVKGIAGEWRPRSRKHRFLKIFDPTLIVRWTEQKWENCV